MTTAPIIGSMRRLLDERSKRRLLYVVDALVIAGSALSSSAVFAGAGEASLAMA